MNALKAAIAAHQDGDLQSALSGYQQVLSTEPNNGAALHGLGVLALQCHESATAAPLFRQAVAAEPTQALYWNNLANALKDLDETDEAIRCYQKALSLNDQDPDTHNDYGTALKELGNYAEAREHYLLALKLDDTHSKAMDNLANILRDTQAYSEALAQHEQALSLEPENSDFHWNHALTLLHAKVLPTVWDEYDFRLHRPFYQARKELPLFQGNSVSDKIIFVRYEQGIGDELLFASCLPDLLISAKQVFLDCDPRLLDLFQRSFPDVTVFSREDETRFDNLPEETEQLFCGSLPRLFRRQLSDFPQTNTYLKADPARVQHWQQTLNALTDKPKIGIAWRSKLQNNRYAHRMPPLALWAPILEAPVTLIKLQYDEATAEIAAITETVNTTIHEPANLDQMNAIDDCAALYCALDGIITVGTAVCELAGGLGCNTALITPACGWALAPETLPWFPTLKAYRQTEVGNWDVVIQSIRDTLPR